MLSAYRLDSSDIAGVSVGSSIAVELLAYLSCSDSKIVGLQAR
jgi:hypothetical protein